MLAKGTSSRWLRNSLSSAELTALDRIAEGDGLAGGRVDWTIPDLASAFDPVTRLVRECALPDARLTRVVWFAKDAETNWGVPWHQDRVIAVQSRHDVEGFGNWSDKRGFWHCEPPLSLFDQMRFVRVHLDDCDDTNGAMEIAQGSEAEGLVPAASAKTVAERYQAELCTARRGDIQILPMLVLHRSLPSKTQSARRALRLDYAAFELPLPLTWRSQT